MIYIRAWRIPRPVGTYRIEDISRFTYRKFRQEFISRRFTAIVVHKCQMPKTDRPGGRSLQCIIIALRRYRHPWRSVLYRAKRTDFIIYSFLFKRNGLPRAYRPRNDISVKIVLSFRSRVAAVGIRKYPLYSCQRHTEIIHHSSFIIHYSLKTGRKNPSRFVVYSPLYLRLVAIPPRIWRSCLFFSRITFTSR